MLLNCVSPLLPLQGGTSIQDLVDATGLNRFGMYQAFGNKGGLFLEVLDKYRQSSADNLFVFLEKDPEGLKSVKAFFDYLITKFSGAKDDKGCLMTNTAVDLPLRCQNTSRKIKTYMKRMEDGFTGACFGPGSKKKSAPKPI